METYGTLTIILEFVRKVELNAKWSKRVTLMTVRSISHKDARDFANEFKSQNPSLDGLIAVWQVDPLFIY